MSEKVIGAAKIRAGATAAFAFVLTMGIVNLFGDTTYEGGAAINGQFLAPSVSDERFASRRSRRCSRIPSTSVGAS
jgi:hypothetical protein